MHRASRTANLQQICTCGRAPLKSTRSLENTEKIVSAAANAAVNVFVCVLSTQNCCVDFAILPIADTRAHAKSRFENHAKFDDCLQMLINISVWQGRRSADIILSSQSSVFAANNIHES